MLGISLWEPWASAMAIESKLIETRGWKTDYRGPVAIHAAKRHRKAEMLRLLCRPYWLAALSALCRREEVRSANIVARLSFGSIVAVGELFDCRPTEDFDDKELDAIRAAPAPLAGSRVWTERQLGDFSPGRYGWVFKNIRRLPRPVPFRGSQRFFNVPDGPVCGDRGAPAEIMETFGREITGGLKQQLRRFARENQTSMQSVVADALRDYLGRPARVLCCEGEV